MSTRATPKPLLLLKELRSPFLIASGIPVLLGASLAFHDTGQWNWPLFLWILGGVLLIHAGANVANDYFDHRNGCDAANTDFVRPFTGGSRLIQEQRLTPMEVLSLSTVCLLLGSAVGVYLSLRCGLVVLLLGAVGALGGIFYSAPPLRLAGRGMGEAVVALNFGILPVVGTVYVLTGRFPPAAFLVSLPMASLIAAILVINQFQDIRADNRAGKRNWVVRLGLARARWLYAALVLAWAPPLILGVVAGYAPRVTLVALTALIPGGFAIAHAFRHAQHPTKLTRANAMTILIHAMAGTLMAGALLTRASLLKP